MTEKDEIIREQCAQADVLEEILANDTRKFLEGRILVSKIANDDLKRNFEHVDLIIRVATQQIRVFMLEILFAKISNNKTRIHSAIHGCELGMRSILKSIIDYSSDSE